MAHTIHNQKRLLTRVRRIKGQAEALETALAQQAECVAVLQQIAAIRGAVNGLMAEVLEGHIREHLGRSDVSPATRAADLEEVVAAVRSYMKWRRDTRSDQADEDFIPVLGYLDDLIIVPLGILLVVRLIPAELMAEFRAAAAERSNRPVSRVGAAVFIAIWVLAAALLLLAFV